MLAAGAIVVLLAFWLRNPIIPYDGDTPGASSSSGDSAAAVEERARAEKAVTAMSARIARTHAELGVLATAALDVPADPATAFGALPKLLGSRDQGVLVTQAGQPFAWAGQIRAEPLPTVAGTSVSFDQFYVSLRVVAERGSRQAVAFSLVHADPPANAVATTLESRVDEASLVDAFTFAPATDSVGALVRGTGGVPLLRIDATAQPAERVRFASVARARARGIVLLALVVFLMVGVGWSDRRKVGRRLFTVAVALAAVAIIPWSSFSNISRAFDPAYYYLRTGGPFTATAGALALFASLTLLAVIALIRSRRARLDRRIAAVAAVALVGIGIVAARHAASGIVLPRWGSTASLWLQWELPVFLILLSCLLAAAWLGGIAARRRPRILLRTAAMIAVAAGAIASFLVWNNVTEQRLQLSMRDVASLERPDADAAILLDRSGAQLAGFDSPGTRADLLERYARSDLAAAEVQASLSLWDATGARYGSLDIARLTYDSAELALAVRSPPAAGTWVVTQTMGPSGRQLTLVVSHRGGGSTSIVASPRTRLVAQAPHAPLLGLEQPDQAEPPYLLTLADLTARSPARTDVMTWRRVGNEWHGDQIIETSQGLRRAHVEVDIRALGTRIVRAALIVMFDVAVAGVLWAFGAMAEGGFFRWVGARASRWGRSYRGRLTLALFTFFVVPAVAFGWWSYQRLRGDDRDVRELLVRETLHAAAGEDPLAPTVTHAAGETPLFLYSRGVLTSSSDSLYAMIAPAGRLLPPRVHLSIAEEGELTAAWQQRLANSRIFWGYRAGTSPGRASYVLAAPARGDEIVLDRRRRDLTMLVLFATAVGGLAAFWLSGIAARVLARDLELSRVEVARAERVLAWGEMARQVAHEIKNPLTPIRLGVQHLRRARADTRIDFDRVLDDNVTRILSEIDRLDEIARAFSRYGTAPSELPPAEPVDVASILRDVVGLEKMGIGGVSWSLQGADDPAFAAARADELRDVLLNVFENARLARARNVSVTLYRSEKLVTIAVSDDGGGIAPTALPRVFEPHFSTRTTGSGLGLAISRRLLESWGGTIDLASEEGRGAIVTINLHSAAS